MNDFEGRINLLENRLEEHQSRLIHCIEQDRERLKENLAQSRGQLAWLIFAVVLIYSMSRLQLEGFWMVTAMFVGIPSAAYLAGLISESEAKRIEKGFSRLPEWPIRRRSSQSSVV